MNKLIVQNSYGLKKTCQSYNHRYNKYEQAAEQIHVANINFEILGNRDPSPPIYYASSTALLK